ncbi:hypothetical protein [Rossellomorea marisflavi]|uniref:hypothetical protein n=1 Tax=Rossellomorea marisflavi TaxID=189381 RepID=UPI00064F9C64|nr:hypothetical protein [Rossellomorea marisflavi]KMK93140.1 hypothetical protein VL03_15020 [Rossellomorea marisflavi]
MLWIGLLNVLLLIVLVLFLTKGWAGFEAWLNKRLEGKCGYRGQFVLMSGIIFSLLLSGVVAINYTYHFLLLNTMFVSSFFLMLYSVASPFLAKSRFNTETVQRRYISSSGSADREVTSFSLPVTPFMMASFGIVLVTVFLTVAAYW